ncbi:tetratricopeptide repeat protein [Mucilaginibacter auburnensis]|uniref:Tetratricopeptide repeat protein n=1 Tax=Mucilaginibacter auburnensis TaxID=1457233 RepID=A0A2H9VQN7_9SPHI|nr:tetratricopeptide repeat protein [Mucilaginibacter auburnensis]PJJ83124.1 tetratricopeptide repeat protein [Mucilaginibacter auburnensis]
MLLAKYPKLLLVCFVALLLFVACNSHTKVDVSTGAVSGLIKTKIAEGKRVADVNSDSLKIIVRGLYELYRSSRNDSALVYADYFESAYNWRNSQPQKAMQLAIKSLANAQSAGLTNDLPAIYLLITGIETQLTNYAPAYSAIQTRLDIASKNSDTASIIALEGLKGMFKRSEGVKKTNDKMLDESLAISNYALKMAETNAKYEWLQIRQLNSIGQCYVYKTKYSDAVPYFKKAIDLAIKYKQRLSLIRSYCRLGEALYYLGNQTQGLAYLNKAVVLTKEKGEPYWLNETTATLYRCYSFSKDYKQAMRYNMENQSIRDSLEALDNVRHVEELQLKYEAANHEKEIKLLNAQNKFETYLLYTAILILLLLGVIAALFFSKQNKEKKLLKAEKALLDDELRAAEIELSAFTESLKDKNHLLEEFKNEIEHLQSQHFNKADIEHMEQLLKAHIMTDESWDRFKKLFDKVHPGFLRNIKNNVPENTTLTATDIRILALIKLQLSNNEMANLAGITVEGIKKSKQRLRKKLGLEAVESLTKFVESV